jgi:recombination protein RecA
MYSTSYRKKVLMNKEEVDPKSTARELVIDAIRKKHGKAALILSEKDFPEIKRISSFSLSLDKALAGGWARGRAVEIFGPESGGKTTLALHAIAECQASGGTCSFIDAEHALDPEYATNLRVDLDKLLISQPDCGEQALDIVDLLVRSNAIDLIVVDSVAALVPRSELEGDMGDTHMGLQARLMSQALRKLTAITQKSGTTVIFINQIRMKIGGYGNPETTTGGNALKFYASQRVDVRRIGAVKEGEVVVANRTRAKVIKNKVGPPARQAEFDIVFGKGIDRYSELLDLAVKHNIIVKNGSWFSYKNANLGQGKVKTSTFLQENAPIRQEIEELVREKL